MGKNKDNIPDSSLEVEMSPPPSAKAKLICVLLAAALGLISFICGMIEMNIYRSMTGSCTAQVTGVVDNKAQGTIHRSDPAVTKYLTSLDRDHHWIHISVETDGVFKTSEIYADVSTEQKGDTVMIHYDPNDPGEYYIGSRVEKYKSYAVTLKVISGLIAAGAILLAWAVFRKKPEPVEDDGRKHYDSEFGRFRFVEGSDHGYECDIRWAGKESITVYFDTDTLRTEEPGECYSRLRKHLLDKKYTDSEVKKRIARYFAGKSELTREGAQEEELIAEMELFHIGSYRNGSIEFSIDTVTKICADDIRLVYKPGGRKEICYVIRDDSGSTREYTEQI